IAPATARANRTTTNPRSGLQIRRMILLDVVLLTTLRLIPNEVLCFCRRLIHPSAWKGYSANFAFTEFSGVQVLFVLWGTFCAVGHILVRRPGVCCLSLRGIVRCMQHTNRGRVFALCSTPLQ